MAQDDIATWLGFALQQMAAESYLNGISWTNPQEVMRQLQLGNNNIVEADPNAPVLPGKTRITSVQAEQFTQRFQIIDHHANDASGFSATLMFDSLNNSYTLSFRSTEPRPSLEGGDVERDGIFASVLTAAADGEIIAHGFAFAQLMAMERYFEQIRQGQLTNGMTDPALKALFDFGGRINVTGFSLGGHLATVFTELHQDQVSQAYVFNAAGRGRMSGFSGLDVATLSAEEALIGQMLKRFNEILFSPDPASWSPPSMAGILDQLEQYHALQSAAQAAVDANPSWDPFRSGLGENLYLDPRYQWAKLATSIQYGTLGMAEVEIQTGLTGIAATQGAFSRITQLYGLAATGDANAVAISGLFAGPANPVLIEGQPLLAGQVGLPRFKESGSSHSITLIVDSLAVQELIQDIDPRYGQSSAELLIRGASYERALGGVAPVDTDGVAEADSLEKIVDAFRKLFRDPALGVPPLLPSDSRVGGFANFTNRNALYDAMAEVRQAVQTKQTDGVVFTIDDLTNPTVSAPTLAGIADTDTDQGLAYRYALKELNPFAVVANTPQANDALYALHNDHGQLDRFSLADGTGTLTSQYLDDRALFLADKIALNLSDRDTSTRGTYFIDVASDYEITPEPSWFHASRRFIFGSDLSEQLEGGGKGDHIHGGDGVDVLIGNGGQDYLEGGGGSDRLEGGADADRMFGGKGNDTYLVDDLGDRVIEGTDNGSDTVESSVSFALEDNVEDLVLAGTDDVDGTGNDLDNTITGNSGINRLDGKGGADHLIGGIGNDVLIGGAGDGDLLEGGVGFDAYYYNAGDGVDQIEDSDAKGRIFYDGQLLLGGVRQDGDPADTYRSVDRAFTYVMSGGHLIVNGLLTINADFETGQFGVKLVDGPDIPSYQNNWEVREFQLSEQHLITATMNVILRGTASSDDIAMLDGNDEIYGYGGNDFMAAGLGHDRVYGGDGNDQILGSFYYVNQWPSPFTETADQLDGDDALYGEAGNDFIIGQAGDDQLFGGEGNDNLNGDNDLFYSFYFSPPGGDDLLDGGAGDDILRGDYGGDVLIGGDGDDAIYGDYLLHYKHNTDGQTLSFVAFEVGRAGEDYLDGGDGADVLYGDGGSDTLIGGAGNDTLYGDYGETVQVGEGYLFEEVGDDYLDGGSGDDLLHGLRGHDVLSGGMGADQLFGAEGDDELYGGVGDDQLFGDYSDSADPGKDVLRGDEGNDLLYGAGGDDLLDGGDHDDELQGGVGNDGLFGGRGDDRLYGQEGDDSLSGEEGVDQLSGGAGDDAVFGDDENDVLLGDEGNDTIFGGRGDDGLRGGHGDDILDGGEGNDFYVFHLGDGQDVISDGAGSQEVNELVFGPGIALADLTFVHDPARQSLMIQINGGADSVELLGVDPSNVVGTTPVKLLGFSDGSQIALADQLPLAHGFIGGDEGDETIRTGFGDDIVDAQGGNDAVFAGAGNDVVIGGAGNDDLQGGIGQDTYVFNAGDGIDRVSDTPGEGNRLVFGPGVLAASVTLERAAEDSLSVRTGVASDAIQILDHLAGGDLPSIDVLEFADGSTLSIGELFARGIQITGTVGADTLMGTSLIDRISGNAGNDFIDAGLGADIVHGDEGDDQLFGGDGADQLDGGAGIDALNGEAGQDTYIFGRGYGQDTLQDSPVEQSGPNTIQFAGGINLNEVRLQARRSEDGVNVVLTINGTQDELTLLGASDFSLLPINEILFADGVRWDTTEIVARIEGVRITAPVTGSFLEGTAFRDELIGMQGNDTLDGLGGADRMVGGGGDDRYWVESPGDTVVETIGDGTDTVYSLINYTLPDQVENLLLRTTAQSATDPVRGEGNASANLLLGNFVNNVLLGGEGNDVLWGGFSIGSDFGPGDDDMYGGAGNDTYVVEGEFNGFDTIHDLALPGEGNRLQFGNSVRPADVVFVQEGSSLRITNAGGTDGAVLADFDPSGMTGSLVAEVVAFSSGVEDITGGYETRLLALMNPTVGTGNADTMTGTSNAEVIKAQGGDDVIAGGAGNDVLIGGTGNDTYVSNPGDGLDLIDEQTGTEDINTVQFGTGFTQDMLHVSYSGTSGIGGLTVRVGTSGDGLYFLGVSAEDSAGPHAVDRLHFADGTHLTFAQLFEREILVQGTGRSDGELFGTFTDDRMLGLGGSEVLSSGAGNDTLIGGPGNDVLDGGEGSDTYVFNPGDGIDEIRDDIGVRSFLDLNRLRFGLGITASDLTLFNNGDGITVNRVAVGTSGDQILLPNFADSLSALKVAEFADGVTLDLYDLYAANLRTDNQTIIDEGEESVLIGGMGNDALLGEGSNSTLLGGIGDDALIGGGGTNLLMGGRGNDLLQGGAGHDTYLFNLGDGIDRIQDVSAVGEGNRIQFGAGITRNDLTFTHDQATRTLTIQVGAAGMDELLLNNFDPSGANGSLVVEMLVFTDGSMESLSQLLGLGGPAASSGDDALTTGPGNDVIDTMAGNDTVDAGAGNDTVTGGIGNDTLTGGPGDDTYLFNPGDGIDTINDTSGPGEGNTVQFGQGIDPASLNLDLGSLLIHVGANGDALHLTTFDSDNVLGPRTIETFRFADGTTLSYNQLVQRGFDLTGTAGSETIIGTNITDRISGLAGFDVLDGRAGADVLAGGPGDDTYVVDNVGDLVTENLNEGIDTVQSSIDYTLGADIERLILTGTAALSGVGNAQNNQLTGNSGHNLLDGAAGSDYLVGGDGDDTLQFSADGSWTTGFVAQNTGSPGYAGTGQTVALNGKNRSFDVFQGDAGADRLEGTAGADALALDDPFSPFPQVAGPRLLGVEAIDVGAGNDVVDLTSPLYAYGDITLTGGSGDDVLWANAGNDLLEGGAGSDNLNGGAGSDRLAGGDGNDTLDGGGSADRLLGGLGNDSYLIDDIGDDVVEFAGEGVDTVKSAITYRLGDHLENLTLTGTAAINAIGNSGNNTLTGNSAANVLSGGLGNDIYVVGEGDVIVEGLDEGTDIVQSSQTWTLADQVENLTLTGTASINGTGNSGSNTLTGNNAANVLSGGQGDDIYVVGVGDWVVENLNEGLDTIQSARTWTLVTNVERLTLTGGAVSEGTGNELNNILTGNSAANLLIGNAGDDMLNGGAGIDRLLGGTGNDTYVVDNAGDIVTEQANEGTDLVQSSVSYVLSANIENLILMGISAINATGNSLVNTLTGNTGANVLDGGAGADTLIGGAGNDIYIVDDASDVVSEAAGQGADTVQSAIAYTLSADVENLTLTGAVAINGMGNVLNNVMTGNNAANILAGGAGNDTYVVSTGDTVVENANEGTDTVQSDVTWTLGANLENLTLTGIASINATGNSGANTLRGNSAVNVLTGGAGNDTYVVSTGDSIVENANEGTDTIQSDVSWTLGVNLENLTLTGTAAISVAGNGLTNTLTGNGAANQLAGAAGNDTLKGGLGNDIYLVSRGEGQDMISENDATVGNSDLLLYGATINPLDLVLSRQANDLRLTMHGTIDRVTIQNWFSAPATAQVETIQAGNGQTMLNMQVDQLIQAMATFTAQTGLTWDQAIDQRPQDVQAVLAASWH